MGFVSAPWVRPTLLATVWTVDCKEGREEGGQLRRVDERQLDPDPLPG